MILVTGSTGLIGRHLVPALVGAGWSVRVLLPPQRGRRGPELPWSGIQVDRAFGSLFNAGDLALAMDGVHTVYHLSSAQWWGSNRDLERVDVEGTRFLVEAALRTSVGRVIVMSHLGASAASAYGLQRAKGQMEALVINSGLPYTVVRSGVVFGEEDSFVNNLAMLTRTNPFLFMQPGQGETLLHPVYVDDLVKALVLSMETLDTVDRIVEIGGPEYLTFNEMTRTVMRVTNGRRFIISVPPYFLRWLTGVMRRLFPRWPATPQWFDILADHRTAGLNSMFETYGLKPVRFEDTIATYMQGRRYLPQLLRFVFRRGRPRGV